MNIEKLKVYAMCMLLGISFLSVAGAGVDIQSGISLSFGGADVPTWESGNYWTYNLNLSYETSGASADLKLNDLHFEVTAVGSENYTLTFN